MMTARRKSTGILKMQRFTMEELTARIPDDDESRTPHLRPWDPKHLEGFVIDRKHKTIDIWWGGYEYWIEVARINTPERCLSWIEHMTGKTWAGMTPQRINAFVRAVAKINGWSIYGL
jgi:hypothetical protein